MTAHVAPVLGVLAHLVHYTLVLGGTVVVVVLLVSARPGRRHRAVTPHERRVEALREAAFAGRLEAGGAPATAPSNNPSNNPSITPATSAGSPAPGTSRDPSRRSTAVMIAIISSAAAAGVHAAAGPVHFQEGLLVGGFFVVSAIAQLGWSVALLLRGADRRLLLAGLAGNAAIVVLWALTRTVGLPFGLVEVEPVGTWDVAATAWEVVIVVCCGVALTGEFARGNREMVDMVRWSAASRAWLVGSVLVMVALTLTGAPA